MAGTAASPSTAWPEAEKLPATAVCDSPQKIHDVEKGLGKSRMVALPRALPGALETIISTVSGDNFERQRRALEETRATAAIMTHGDFEFTGHRRLEVQAQATLTYFGSPRKLFIFSLKDHPNDYSDDDGDDGCSTYSPQKINCVDLATLQELASRYFRQGIPETGPFLWPVLHQEVAEAILSVQAHVFMGRMRSTPMPFWKRCLVVARISVPDGMRPFIAVLYDHIGPDSAYVFARCDFFTQKLWMLALWSVLAVALDVDPSRVTENTSRRICWEVYKAGIWIWGLLVLLLGIRRSDILHDDGIRDALMSKVMRLEHSKTRSYMRHSHVFKLVCYALPTITLFIGAVTFILFLTTQLIINMIYKWGRCIKYDCTTPQELHGFWGWLAEVGVDIMLALIFEIAFALTKSLSEWVALLRAFETVLDYKLSVQMLSTALSSIERLGTFAVLAFIFTPDWNEPSERIKRGGKLDPRVDCSGLLFGKWDMWCFSQKLPVRSRRKVFQKAFKGPFVVAPFVGMIVKVLIPEVALKLDDCANRVRCCCCKAGQCCLSGFVHILGLIFSADGDTVGCFKYVCKGWPFQDVKIVKHDSDLTRHQLPENLGTGVAPSAHPGEVPENESAGLVKNFASETSDGQRQDHVMPKSGGCEDNGIHSCDESQVNLVQHALSTVARKVWSPLDELLEMKLSFLWILAFLPVMPFGIFPTLVARIFESRTDLGKMIAVRSIDFPQAEQLLHVTETTFIRAVVFGGIGWQIGLSLITYNDDLWKNKGLAFTYAGLLVFWQFIAGWIMMRKLEVRRNESLLPIDPSKLSN